MNPQDREFFYSLAMSIMKRQEIIIEQLSALSRAYAHQNEFAIEESEDEIEYDVE